MVFSLFQKKNKDYHSKRNESDTRKVLVIAPQQEGGTSILETSVLDLLTQRGNMEVFVAVQNLKLWNAQVAESSSPQCFQKVQAVVLNFSNSNSNRKAAKRIFRKHNFDRLIIMPPTEEPDFWPVNDAILWAQDAGCVQFCLVASIVTACLAQTHYGRYYNDIERTAREQFPFGYCILRLPIPYMDEWKKLLEELPSPDTYCDPRNPTATQIRSITIQNAAQCFAEIAVKPNKHQRKIYNLVAPAFTLEQVLNAWNQSNNTNVVTKTVKYDQWETPSFWSEWQKKGNVELCRLTNQKEVERLLCDNNDNKVEDDYETIMGKKPTTIQEWCQGTAAAS